MQQSNFYSSLKNGKVTPQLCKILLFINPNQSLIKRITGSNWKPQPPHFIESISPIDTSAKPQAAMILRAVQGCFLIFFEHIQSLSQQTKTPEPKVRVLFRTGAMFQAVICD
jgi:hypothetical protein